MDSWTKDTLKARYEELNPWYHKHHFPGYPGVGHTREQEYDQRVTRMIRRMEEHGAFSLSMYPLVLDLGANSGLLSMWFVDNKGSEVVAVENNPRHFSQLEIAIEVKGYAGKVRPFKKDILASTFGKDKYDLVLLLGVMNLVPVERRKSLLETVLRALKPGCEIALQSYDRVKALPILKAAGFEDCRKLYTYTGMNEPQTAWLGTKHDPEKHRINTNIAVGVLERALRACEIADGTKP